MLLSTILRIAAAAFHELGIEDARMKITVAACDSLVIGCVWW